MIIAGRYPFKDGERYISGKYPHLLEEVRTVVHSIDASTHITKISREKTMVGRALYDPKALNKSFKREFNQLGWDEVRIPCDYPTKYYVEGYNPTISSGGAFREMDFIKEKLGIEVQFGKYAFMVYNVAAKMTIFRNLGFIDSGLEIVPMKQFADRMSTGVSYFEQIAWDLEQRGVADIDVPALVVGIDA
jgi:hypothetical protein